MKKPRSDSKLKLLSEEQQLLLMEWANTKGREDGATPGERSGGLRLAAERAHLDFGIKVSVSTMHDFVSWWRLQQRFAAANSRAEQIAEVVRRRLPDMDVSRLQEITQALFTLEAVEEKDPKSFVALQQLKLSQEIARTSAALEREKIAIRKSAEERGAQELVLAKARFRRDTCELFLEWFEKEEARKIATSSATNSEKIEALGRAMFGENWREGA